MQVEVQYQEETVRRWAVARAVLALVLLLALSGFLLFGFGSMVDEATTRVSRSMLKSMMFLVALSSVTSAAIITSFKTDLCRIAHQLAKILERAQAHEKTAVLFGIFRPSQEEVDRQLAIRAHCLDQACAIQADFYGKNHHFLGDRAEGDRQVIHGQLIQAEQLLKDAVKEQKAIFYSLFDNLRNHGFTWRDGWRPYLTHANVGRDHPEVVSYAQRLGAGLAAILKDHSSAKV